VKVKSKFSPHKILQIIIDVRNVTRFSPRLTEVSQNQKKTIFGVTLDQVKHAPAPREKSSATNEVRQWLENLKLQVKCSRTKIEDFGNKKALDCERESNTTGARRISAKA
jgi:hypothetical protein